MKSWGGHHLFVAVPILAVLYLLPAEISLPLAHGLAWFFKELGEATERAGSTKMAFARWGEAKTRSWPSGIWEHWDWITPSIAGALVWAVKWQINVN